MNWHEWNLIQFLCYSGIIALISGTITAFYVIQNRELIQRKEKELYRKRFIKIYKHKDGKRIQISPPPHPGGRKRLELDKEAARLILEEGYTKDSAWEKLKPDYINSEIEKNQVGNREEQREYYNDPQNLKPIKENFYKRVNRIIGQNYS